MSDGALQPGYDGFPPTSAVEASGQVLTGRYLRLAAGSVLPDEAEYPDRVIIRDPSRPPIEAVASAATSESVEIIEAIEGRDVNTTLPPTSLDPARVTELLNEDLSFDRRIGNLLAYAWNSSSIIERAVPSDLIYYATDNPTDWYEANLEVVKALLEKREGLIDLYSLTDPYEPVSPFLRNATRIHDIAINRRQQEAGLRLEVSARMIVLEAIRARDHDMST